MRCLCRETFEAPNPIDALPEVEHGMTTHDLFIKDAFLVFRALCKLTMKALNNERLVLCSTSAFPASDKVITASVISSRMLCVLSYCLCTLF